MDAQAVGLIGLIVALVTTIIGAFAYIMGEIRKVGNSCRSDIDDLSGKIERRFSEFETSQGAERRSMRIELVQQLTQSEQEMRRVAERVVRREDMESLEARLSRQIERLSDKVDNMPVRSGIRSGIIPRATGEQ